ncbi:DUF3168 domain-containing protein [Stakelama pacifica]|nr:DUF3168 domain-containing protein [Stakelama pacifica]
MALDRGMGGMSGGEALRRAVAAALADAIGAEVTAVFDAPPLRSAMPYALVEEAQLSDWSTKDMAGRDGRVSVVIHDAGERPERLRGLAERAEAAIGALPSALGEGWRIAALTLTRSRIVRQGERHWSALIEFRVGMLRSN